MAVIDCWGKSDDHHIVITGKDGHQTVLFPDDDHATIECIFELKERIAELEAERGWISVENRLPEIDQFVLWRHKSGACSVWEMDKDMDWQWVVERYGYETPTHWMPLPEPPEGE